MNKEKGYKGLIPPREGLYCEDLKLLPVKWFSDYPGWTQDTELHQQNRVSVGRTRGRALMHARFNSFNIDLSPALR